MVSVGRGVMGVGFYLDVRGFIGDYRFGWGGGDGSIG